MKKAIYIRVTSSERKAINAAAKDADISVNELGKALLLGFAEHRAKPHHWPTSNSDRLIIAKRSA